MSQADSASPLFLAAPHRSVVASIAGGVFIGIVGLLAVVGIFVPYTPAESTVRLPLIIGAILLLTFAVFCVARAPRLGVTLYADRAVVTGQLWSRTVPRDSIEDIAPLPALIWRDAQGRKHHTQINALAIWRDADDAPAEVRDEIAEKTKALIEWARAGDNAFARVPAQTAGVADDTEDPFTTLGL
ncbi:hypothetical protein ABH923_000317 [Leifsonia sp. EB41]|uniref:hypothetical protein n=1 Tax=Leifsonia sp. EB41 TaxID=3156260 RepID=UPI00351704B5